MVATVMLRQDQVASALDLFRESQELYEHVLLQFGSAARRLFDVSVSKTQVANVLLKQGQVAPALALFCESEKLHESLLQKFGPTSQRLRELCDTLAGLVNCFIKTAQRDEALQAAQRGRAVALRLGTVRPSAFSTRCETWFDLMIQQLTGNPID